MMTWPEVKAALEAGKTTALVYTGGTEQRGPQTSTAGHNLMARETVKGGALKLGNAIFPRAALHAEQRQRRCRHDRADERASGGGARTDQRPGDHDRLQNVILMGDHGQAAERIATRRRNWTTSTRRRDGITATRSIRADGRFGTYLKSQNLPTGARRDQRHVGNALPRRDKGWGAKGAHPDGCGGPAARAQQRHFR